MKKVLPEQSIGSKTPTRIFHKAFWQNQRGLMALAFMLLFGATYAQGTWSPVVANCPAAGAGVMLLLSDGTVMCKTNAGGTDGIGNTWYKLTPDKRGSYTNGKWTKLASMINTRLYFSSQVLKDGRVYVAGGEYGTGGSAGETYDPLTNVWTAAPAPGFFLSDANSEILPDGRVLQAMVTGTLKPTKIYNPTTNTYANGPNCLGIHNESSWVKLPDNSILFVDRQATTSERYIPALNQWIADATVPVALYDPYGLETGAALLLPDGRAWFIGSNGHTAYYTPSGSTSQGSWAAGPDFPNAQGAPDAPAAMMVNGKILCTVSPVPTSFNHFPSPTSFYEFDYLTNTYTRLNSPGGALTANVPCYVTNMLDLPDGSVLFSYQDSSKYYVYKPTGSPLASGKPVINNITKSGSVYTITGTLFNGISEGACYGDDWQMASNYPIVKLKLANNVAYARTYNWNSTGVRRGSQLDTAQFTLPAGLPLKTFSLYVIANGISSDPVSFTNSLAPETIASADEAVAVSVAEINSLKIYPNPAENQTNIRFALDKAAHVMIKVFDMNGREMTIALNADLQKGDHSVALNTSKFAAGIYSVRMITETGIKNVKLVVR